MNTSAQTGADTTAVRAGYSFDEQRLAAWLRDNVEGFQGPLTVEQFKGGQSNPTYLLRTPRRSYVLRRKPPGELLKGAHAVDREARVQLALARAEFPVPFVHCLCTDASIIGTWFYVMDKVEGRIFWDATFPQVTNQERPEYFRAMNETLARLHCIDYQGAGLADYGRTGDYFQRQISRWSRQYHEDTQAGRNDDMDHLIQWLLAHIPASERVSIVHGDYRCDNLIFDPHAPKVIAVLDWELSTLGHPLADFAYHALMYHLPPTIVAGLVGADLAALNIPSEQEYVAMYCRHSNIDSIPAYDFYVAFSLFRLAAIFHGIKGRVARGTAVSESARQRAQSFPELARLGWEQAQRTKL